MGCNLEQRYDNTYSKEKKEEPKKKRVSEIPSFINNSIYRKTHGSEGIFIKDFSYTPPQKGYVEQIYVEIKDNNILVRGKGLLPIKHKILSSNFYEIKEDDGLEMRDIAVFKTDKGEVQIFKESNEQYDFYIKSENLIFGHSRFNEQKLKNEFSF